MLVFGVGAAISVVLHMHEKMKTDKEGGKVKRGKIDSGVCLCLLNMSRWIWIPCEVN
jgi:hypothetical protein